ncbi:MAG: hypothetical protein AAF411_01105 [Myxococcota bacterium]
MRSLFAVLILAFGCGPDEVVQAPDRIDEVEPATRERPARQDQFLYDEEGNLRESDETVAGLVLPRGLELTREAERTHIYSTPVPRDKLLAYFGPRLFTGAVDAIGDGAIYRGARVNGARGSEVRLDVSVLRTGARTRVEITELPPMPANLPTPAEVQARYREYLRTAE